MYHTTITNPKTKRRNQVRAWPINPKAVMAKFKGDEWQSAKDISFALLDDDESIQEMRDEKYGDCAARNFALSIFENALDWRLGIAVLDILKACLAKRRMPKPFSVAVNRAGDVFIIGASGKVYVT